MQYKRYTARFVELPGGERRSRDRGPFEGMEVRMLASPQWRPPMDICETDDRVIVSIELAGLHDDDTNVTLFGDALVVEGVRTIDRCDLDGHVHRSEIYVGPFRVEVPLPFAVEPSGVDATYHHGILTVVLPRDGRDLLALPALPEERQRDEPPRVH